MLTLFGALAVTFMMLMYALERRDQRFILAFACGCPRRRLEPALVHLRSLYRRQAGRETA